MAAESSVTSLTLKPLEEIELSLTLKLKGTEENESSASETTVKLQKEIKKLSIAAGKKLKNVTTAEGNQKKKIKLITEDGVVFEVDPFIAEDMQTVQSFIEQNDGGDGSVVVEIPDVTSHCLSLIIEYCMQHCRVAESESDNGEEELKLFDEKFVKRMNTNELKELLLAARSLNMKNFLTFMIGSVANAIKDKSVEFMRDFLGKENDFTPEEEADYKKENAWAFENIDQD